MGHACGQADFAIEVIEKVRGDQRRVGYFECYLDALDRILGREDGGESALSEMAQNLVLTQSLAAAKTPAGSVEISGSGSIAWVVHGVF